MVKTRGQNGKFIGVNNKGNSFGVDFFYYIKIAFIVFLLAPFLYHVCIRKSYLSNFISFLHHELGCSCETSTGTKSNGGYFN